MQRLARQLSSSSASLSISSRGRSCTQCQRYSVVASAHSDTSPQRRGGGNVSKIERRSLVESFVNKYRVMNAGKFPTPSHVKSAVGGSYYTVKKIVQELQHESQTPSAGMFHNNQQYERVKKENEPLSRSVEDSCGQMLVCEEISVDTLIGTSLGNEEDSTSKSLSYADQAPNNIDICSKISDDVYTGVLERDIETEAEVTEIVDVNKEEVRPDTQLHGSTVSRSMASGLQEVSKEISSSKDNGPADTTKLVYMLEEGHEIMSTSKISSNESVELADTKYVPGLGVEPKDYPEESTQVGEFTRNLEKDAETEKISFSWIHMKSLAVGILKIWRKF